MHGLHISPCEVGDDVVGQGQLAGDELPAAPTQTVNGTAADTLLFALLHPKTNP